MADEMKDGSKEEQPEITSETPQWGANSFPRGHAPQWDSKMSDSVLHWDVFVNIDSRYWDSFLPLFYYRLASFSRERITKFCEPYGIAYAHAIYLIGLDIEDGKTPYELSTFLDLDAGNTSRALKTLEELGYIVTDRKTEKSRKYHVFLTESGKALAVKIRNFQIESLNNDFAGVSDDEIIALRRTLVKILRNCDPDLDAYMSDPRKDPFYSLLLINSNESVCHQSRHVERKASGDGPQEPRAEGHGSSAEASKRRGRSAAPAGPDVLPLNSPPI